MSEPVLPPAPIRPDCCFGGCAQCVLDDYTEELQRWQQQCEAVLAEHAAKQPGTDDADLPATPTSP